MGRGEPAFDGLHRRLQDALAVEVGAYSPDGFAQGGFIDCAVARTPTPQQALCH
jgi:hypothetical protein